MHVLKLDSVSRGSTIFLKMATINTAFKVLYEDSQNKGVYSMLCVKDLRGPRSMVLAI